MIDWGYPKTVDEAVERLISELPLKDKVYIASLGPDETDVLYISFFSHIIQEFGLGTGNRELGTGSLRDRGGWVDVPCGSAAGGFLGGRAPVGCGLFCAWAAAGGDLDCIGPVCWRWEEPPVGRARRRLFRCRGAAVVRAIPAAPGT